MLQADETVQQDGGRSGNAFSKISRVYVDGRVLRVATRQGDAEPAIPLLIFNGIGGNLELLEPFVEALPGIEIVTFDVPGAGASPGTAVPYRYRHLARLADRLMSKLGYDGEIDVLGVSWGGVWRSNMPIYTRTAAVDCCWLRHPPEWSWSLGG